MPCSPGETTRPGAPTSCSRPIGGYLEYPNRDNVLGPSRLFFSTYLESIWIGNYLAAAMLLREGGLLDEATAEVVSTVADEAAEPHR